MIPRSPREGSREGLEFLSIEQFAANERSSRWSRASGKVFSLVRSLQGGFAFRIGPNINGSQQTLCLFRQLLTSTHHHGSSGGDGIFQ